MVELSPRQKVLYRALRSSASIRALLAQASDLQDSTKVNSLMNIVMQFRKVSARRNEIKRAATDLDPYLKVCNHPYLFERADVSSPFSFGQFSSSGNLLRQDGLYCPAPSKNPISLRLPRLLWQDGGILSKPDEKSRAGFDTKYLQNLLSIWSPDHLVESLKEEGNYKLHHAFTIAASLTFLLWNPASEFAFCRLLDQTPTDISQLAHDNTIGRLLRATKETREVVERAPYLW